MKSGVAIELADEISIQQVIARLSGVEMYADRRMKQWCPLGGHLETLPSRSFRIYPDSNSCFCFSLCGYFRPSTYGAKVWGVSRSEAAMRLCEEFDVAPLNWREQSDLLLQELPTRDRSTDPADASSLRLALGRVFDGAVPERRYSEEILEAESQAERELDVIDLHDRNAVSKWCARWLGLDLVI